MSVRVFVMNVHDHRGGSLFLWGEQQAMRAQACMMEDDCRPSVCLMDRDEDPCGTSYAVDGS